MWHLTWTGTLAALCIMVVQAFARSAIWLIGIAAAPPLWAAVGMATSFAWGTLVFGDAPSHVGLSILGLALLISGVLLVSRAGYLSRLHEAEPGGEKGSGAELGAGLKGLVVGVLYALGAGFAEGSLVAFYQHLERQGASRQEALPRLLCSYFGTFGVVIFALGCATAAAAHAPSALAAWRGEAGSAAGFNSSSFWAGTICGCMWAMANSCSVLASHYLGMALAVAITQIAVGLSGLLGVLVFGEILGARARGTFWMALLTILAGVAVLSLFGRPLQSHGQ